MLAARLTKLVELQFAGKPWRIIFTNGVLLDVEELTGVSAMQLNLGHLSAALLRAILFAVLRAAGAPITLQQAGRMLTFGASPRICSTLVEGWQASMPDPKPPEKGEGDSKPRKPTTTLDAWAEARHCLRLSDEEWLSMTPRMVDALTSQRLSIMRWRELMNALGIAHTLNHSAYPPKHIAQPVSYMIHPWPEAETPTGPVWGEHIMAIFSDAPKLKQ